MVRPPRGHARAGHHAGRPHDPTLDDAHAVERPDARGGDTPDRGAGRPEHDRDHSRGFRDDGTDPVLSATSTSITFESPDRTRRRRTETPDVVPPAQITYTLTSGAPESVHDEHEHLPVGSPVALPTQMGPGVRWSDRSRTPTYSGSPGGRSDVDADRASGFPIASTTGIRAVGIKLSASTRGSVRRKCFTTSPITAGSAGDRRGHDSVQRRERRASAMVIALALVGLLTITLAVTLLMVSRSEATRRRRDAKGQPPTEPAEAGRNAYLSDLDREHHLLRLLARKGRGDDGPTRQRQAHGSNSSDVGSSGRPGRHDPAASDTGWYDLSKRLLVPAPGVPPTSGPAARLQVITLIDVIRAAV